MAEGKQRWFLYGCLGCLGVVVLMVVIGAIVSGVALNQVRKEQVEKQVASYEVPVADVSATGGALENEAPQRVGHVILELTRGDFEIEPVPAGEPLRVEASFDKSAYELSETLEHDDDGGWTYHVRFSGKKTNLMLALRQIFGGSQPRAQIYLPRETPMSLSANVTEAGVVGDLGGLWLTEIDFQLEKGGFQIDVEEPLHRPLERMRLQGSMGGMVFSRLGNASPRRVEVEFGMGGLELDFRGNWVTDSDIDIQAHMGGAVLRLPRDVVIQGLEYDGFRPPEDAEISPPTLRFTTRVSMGEIEIVH